MYQRWEKEDDAYYRRHLFVEEENYNDVP
ncbi:hypothetical protein [Bacillus phage MrBubbles]|nr:hypothetical protein [Bacillus phage MrBubbles]